MKIEFEIIAKEELTDSIRGIFAAALKQQRKVKGNLQKKADRCRLLGIAKIDGEVVGIGAIKSKTNSDFTAQKANIPELADDFKWELGYLYTYPEHARKGIAKNISQLLIQSHGNNNLMAFTEVSTNPGMVRILEAFGFRQYGKPWRSRIHRDYLGLFLRFQ